VPEPAPSAIARIEIAQPRRFTARAVMVISAYGLLLALPIFVAILALSVLKLGILTLLVLLLGVAINIYFLPFGFGNAYAAWLVNSLDETTPAQDSFLVQLTLSPRIRSGLRAIADDADDLGHLSFTTTALVFRGDSVTLSIPFANIQQVQSRNFGLRGLYIYGRRVVVFVSGLPNVTALEFAERSSWLLPTSRKIARKLHTRLAQAVANPSSR
jgi:hypothetical protein